VAPFPRGAPASARPNASFVGYPLSPAHPAGMHCPVGRFKKKKSLRAKPATKTAIPYRSSTCGAENQVRSTVVDKQPSWFPPKKWPESASGEHAWRHGVLQKAANVDGFPVCLHHDRRSGVQIGLCRQPEPPVQPNLNRPEPILSVGKARTKLFEFAAWAFAFGRNHHPLAVNHHITRPIPMARTHRKTRK